MNASLLVVLVVALLLAALARRVNLQPPLVLTVAALAVSVVPSVPDVAIEPHLILLVVLPPLLYSAALDTSLRGFRRDIKAISLLGVALVAATALGIALVAVQLVPGLDMQTAIVLGAVVAPTDAISAISMFRRLGLPRRLTSIVVGENLVNDATSLTLYRLAVVTVAGGTTLFTEPLELFLYGVGAGALVGVVLAGAVALTRRQLDDPVAESALGIVLPFAAYLCAEEVEASGVIAVVAAGLLLGWLTPRAGVAARLQDRTLWGTADLLLESLVFALIGLQLPGAIAAVRDSDVSNTRLLAAAAGVLMAALVIRPLCVFAAVGAYALARRIRGLQRVVPWNQVAVLSWSGMRGVVTLAAAAGIPLETAAGDPFPQRDLIQMLAFTVVVGTLLIQGLSLPVLIRAVGLSGDDAEGSDAPVHPVDAARTVAIRSALEQLDAIVASTSRIEGADEEIRDRVRTATRDLLESRLIESGGEPARDDTIAQAPARRTAFARALRDVRREVVQVERAALIAERDAGRLDDEDLRELVHELDLQEAGLRTELGRADVRPAE